MRDVFLGRVFSIARSPMKPITTLSSKTMSLQNRLSPEESSLSNKFSLGLN